MAEHTILLMLASLRNLVEINENTKRGIWKKQAQGVCTHELCGKTVGLIGMGAIGRKVAGMLKAFGAEVLYNDVSKMKQEDENALGIKFSTREEIIEKSDIISLHCPLTDDTRHMINDRAVNKMKNGVIDVYKRQVLVNIPNLTDLESVRNIANLSVYEVTFVATIMFGDKILSKKVIFGNIMDWVMLGLMVVKVIISMGRTELVSIVAMIGIILVFNVFFSKQKWTFIFKIIGIVAAVAVMVIGIYIALPEEAKEQFSNKINYSFQEIETDLDYDNYIDAIQPVSYTHLTFINVLSKKIENGYVSDENKIHVYHFRPGILPNLGEIGEKAGVMKQDKNWEDPHRRAPAGFFSSVFRIVYYSMDYIIGYKKMVRKDVHYDRFSVFDRYCYDLIADPERDVYKRQIYKLPILKGKINNHGAYLTHKSQKFTNIPYLQLVDNKIK